MLYNFTQTKTESMSQVTAIGFRSNSCFAGLNTTIPNTDIPANEEFKKYDPDNEDDSYNALAAALVFPLIGHLCEDEFHPLGNDPIDWWSADHFVFE